MFALSIITLIAGTFSHLELWLGNTSIDAAIEKHIEFATALPSTINREETSALFNRIVEKENTHKDMHVFYHGTPSCYAFLFDLLSSEEGITLMRHNLNSSTTPLDQFYENVIFPIYLEKQKEYLETATESELHFLHKSLFTQNPQFSFNPETKDLFTSNTPYIRPNRPLLHYIDYGEDVYANQFLCANLSLFGNFGLCAGYGIGYFFNQASTMSWGRFSEYNDFDPHKEIAKRLSQFGIPKEKHDKYLEEFDAHYSPSPFDNGRLYQIFIDENWVNDMVYISEPNGLKICTPGLTTLDLLTKEPQELELLLQSLDQQNHSLFHTAFEHLPKPYTGYHTLPLTNLLQARIWLNPRLFVEGQKQGKIIIYKYDVK